MENILDLEIKFFNQVDKHESQAKQADYKAGFAGHGNRDEGQGAVGTNYVKTKPDSEYNYWWWFSSNFSHSFQSQQEMLQT